jgi:hypothetical protein
MNNSASGRPGSRRQSISEIVFTPNQVTEPQDHMSLPLNQIIISNDERISQLKTFRKILINGILKTTEDPLNHKPNIYDLSTDECYEYIVLYN